ncbi:GNAT family N-acetyltransferase [Kribbella sp. NPDC002412]
MRAASSVSIRCSAANIWSVATAQEERGHGAASAVVATALEHAVAAGCSRAGLGTSDELVPWYSRSGFAEVGRERSAVISQSTAARVFR